MRPDKPGEWHARDGRRIVVFGDPPLFRVRGIIEAYGSDCGVITDLQGDDWLPAAPPVFPELPPKPPQCLVKRDEWSGPEWRVIVDGKIVGNPMSFELVDYEVIPHPDNDSEAVALIKGAKANG